MITLLQELAESRDLACIYRADDLAGFSVGWIAAADGDFTLIYSVTPEGRYDGYSIQETESIRRVDTNSRYLESIRRLLDSHLPPIMTVPDGSGDLVRVLLDFALRNRVYVSFQLGDSGRYDVNGFLLEVQEEVCRMLLVDEYGYPDGISTFAIDDIVRGECDSEVGQTTQRLYDSLMRESSQDGTAE